MNAVQPMGPPARPEGVVAKRRIQSDEGLLRVQDGVHVAELAAKYLHAAAV